MADGHGRGWQIAVMGLLLMSMLACRPLVTVGWLEMAIFFVLVVLVVAPLLWRLYRWLERRAGSDRSRDEWD